ncbi:MAG: hypothetical protein ACRD03_17680 [Acidimicrobiales bacterium]
MTALVLWTGLTGNRMNLGGDDSHLYYLDPWRWLRHAPLSVIDNGFNGFNARVFLFPFVTVIGLLSWLPLNVQGLSFGLLLAATWTGVASLLSRLHPGARDWGPAAQVAASIATLAPVVAATQWSHQLYSIYWMAALPWLVVLALRHQVSGEWRWVWIAVTVTVLLAPAMSAIAWTAACALLAVPLFALGLFTSNQRLHVRRLAVMGVAILGTGLFWILPMVASAMAGQVQFHVATSDTGKEEAVEVVRAIAAVQEPLDTVGLRLSSRLVESLGSSEREPTERSERLAPFGLLPAGLAIVGAVIAEGLMRRTLLVLSALWVVFFWLATVSPVPGGIDAFVWLTRHVPGWTAFRNFHDKFAIPLALTAGLAAGVGFAAVTDRWSSRNRTLAAGAVVAAMVVYGFPLLRGDYFRLPYQSSSPTNRVSDGLPEDYKALLKSVERLPPGGILTVPLRSPAWSIVPTSSRGAYIGISPITMLTGRLDINGLHATPPPGASAVTPVLRSAIERGGVSAIATIVRELGVTHVLVGPVGDQALASREKLGTSLLADAAVWSAYVRHYAPGVIARHGRFALHEIKPTWASAPLELSRPLPEGDEPIALAGLGERRVDRPCPGSLTWDEASPTSYQGRFSTGSGSCALVLRRAFDRRWRLTVDGETIRPNSALGFAAQFPVPSNRRDQRFTLTYDGQSLVRVSSWSSAAAVGLLAVASLRGRRRLSRRPEALAGDPS